MKFTEKLIRWYEHNKRDLPWRHTMDPYCIWLSEVILQQTRVDQGLPYYLKFIRKYPTIAKLAADSEDNILRHWQGLGYYTRARNLHATAKHICETMGGNFPATYEGILKLKGIGKYTAAAIGSFAFMLPYPVVDGNVQRVLARVFGIRDSMRTAPGVKECYALAEKLIDKNNPGTFNQAMMEFGALQCVPVNPDCKKCIFRTPCIARKENLVGLLPLREKKTNIRKRYFNYLVITHKNKIYLQKRKSNDIWKNLYEFPLIEKEDHILDQNVMNTAEWRNIFKGTHCAINYISDYVVHQLSHQKIYARFLEVTIAGKNEKKIEDCFTVTRKQLEKFAIPRIIDKYLELRINSDRKLIRNAYIVEKRMI